MLNVRLACDHLFGKLLFTWLSLVMSMMVSFVLSFFPRDVLDEILNLIESVSEDFPSYSFRLFFKVLCLCKPLIRLNNLKTSLRFSCLGLNPIIDYINYCWVISYKFLFYEQIISSLVNFFFGKGFTI